MQDEAEEEKNELGKKKNKDRKKKQQKEEAKMDGKIIVAVKEGFKDYDVDAASEEEVQVALKKHKKKKSKDLEAKKDQGIPVVVKAEEAELELDSTKDGKKKKRKKDGDGDEDCGDMCRIDKSIILTEEAESKRGEKSRKRKQGDVGEHLTFVAEGKRRKKDKMPKVGALGTEVVVDEVYGDRNKTAGKVAEAGLENVAEAGLENNVVSGSCKDRLEDGKESRKKKDKDGEKPKRGAGRTMVTNNEDSTDYKEVKLSGDKKKSKKKKAFDNCELRKDGNEMRKEDKKSLSVEDEKAAEDGISEVPSSTTTTDKKRKKNKEKKDKKGDNQTAKGPSKDEVNVEDKITEKIIRAAEAERNREMSSMRKEKGTDDFTSSNSKKKKSIKDGLDTSALKKTKKKVSFSSEVEVFPAGNKIQNEEDTAKLLVQGKRFTPEEDNMIREAIDQYIQTHQLGEEGQHMILNCKHYPQIKNCWKEIERHVNLAANVASLCRNWDENVTALDRFFSLPRTCVPYRPYVAVYYRAHVLLERSEKRKWEPEEYDMVRRFYATHGADWKTLAAQLGKHRVHLKDCWRRIKSPNFKKGLWSQDEYQTLFDLVNMDLRMKAFEEKKTKHGMLRDNISWEAISKKLSTRYDAACCDKWYKQLTSPLVSRGLWADVDDYLLLDVLQKVDACCLEDVDWDNLLEHRSGEICRKRWGEMTRHIGGYKEKPFIEQVEVLSKRYCPEMMEYRK